MQVPISEMFERDLGARVLDEFAHYAEISRASLPDVAKCGAFAQQRNKLQLFKYTRFIRGITMSIDVKTENSKPSRQARRCRAVWTDGTMPTYSPVSGEEIGWLKTVSAAETAAAIDARMRPSRRGVWCPPRTRRTRPVAR